MQLKFGERGELFPRDGRTFSLPLFFNPANSSNFCSFIKRKDRVLRSFRFFKTKRKKLVKHNFCDVQFDNFKTLKPPNHDFILDYVID